MTGEDGRRYSAFAYDAKARVTSSSHAGGADAVTLTYPSTGGSAVTDALGLTTTYGLTAWVQGGPTRKLNNLTDPRGSIERTYLDESVDFRRRLSTVKDRRNVETHHSYAEATDPVTGQPARSHSVTEVVGLDEQRTSQEGTDIVSNRVLLKVVANRETRIIRNALVAPVLGLPDHDGFGRCGEFFFSVYFFPGFGSEIKDVSMGQAIVNFIALTAAVALLGLYFL